MKVSALEVRIADKCFAIEMDKVKHFFEVENVLKVPYLPDFVEGIVKYNHHVYPLISLKKVWGLQESNPSTAVAIVMKDREYAILIDEVIKVEKLDKKETFLLEVFEEDGNLISNLNLNFLDDIEIPTFNNHIEHKNISTSFNKDSFLLFECGDEILGVDTKYIKKIEDKQKETFILNNGVLKVLDFEKLYKKCDYNNVLILENQKVLAIGIDKVIDIYLIEKANISTSEGKFDKYFIYNQKEVKVFSNQYLEEIIDKYGMYIPKENKSKIIQKEEILVLNICNKEFAVRMKNVIDISDYDKTALQFANENPNVKGLATTKEGVTYIISFEHILNCEIKVSEDNKIIVLKNEEVLKALLVDEISDIVYVNKDNIIEAKGDSIIGGMVILDDDKMIPLVNLKWPKDL